MNLSESINVSTITVFIEGLLSFFSPCVLPLLPVYIGYLSGGTLKKAEDGTTYYDRRKVIINTLFFVIGISVAFFVLGFGMSAIGKFFGGYKMVFVRIGSIIVIILGLYQLGLFGQSRFLNGEYRLPLKIEKLTMSPFTALLMGFVLSFAWSPCVGPVLSSVLILAATAGSSGMGFALIGVYTLGYIIPFILVGFFTTTLLDFFGKHRNVVKYTVKIGGILLIIMGVLMFTGKMNSVTTYLSNIAADQKSESRVFGTSQEEAEVTGGKESEVTEEKTTEEDTKATETEVPQELPDAYDFTLTDQYGNEHTLSDYKGKIVFLNFWATWCPPCKAELPYIQELYEEYSQMEDSDVVILGVTFPGSGQEQDVDGVKSFLDENGYTFPVLMDTELSLSAPYFINAFPTTFIINAEGKVLGYVPGGMTKDIMKNIIDQARE